jgi:hypothetical protein
VNGTISVTNARSKQETSPRYALRSLRAPRRLCALANDEHQDNSDNDQARTEHVERMTSAESDLQTDADDRHDSEGKQLPVEQHVAPPIGGS